MKVKKKKIFVLSLFILVGAIGLAFAIEIGDNLSGSDFVQLDINTENWCKSIEVEKTTDHIIYWYNCKDVVKNFPGNYTVVGHDLQRGYPIEVYDSCRGRGGTPEQCLVSGYDAQALEDIREHVVQVREDLFRKQRLARPTREFPPGNQRFTEEEING